MVGDRWTTAAAAVGGTEDSYQAKISSNDAVPDFLESKIVAGPNVEIVVLNEGGDESLSISATGSGFDGYNVKVSGTDSTPDYLVSKLTAAGLLDYTILNASGDEELQISIDLDAYATTAELDLKADLTLLDSYQEAGPYITYSDIDAYAKKELLDAYQEVGAYITFTDIDGYAEKFLLDSYQVAGPYITFTDIDGYAEKYLLDAYQETGPYITYSDIDAYAKKELLDAYQVTGPYITYSDIDGYAKKELLDGYLSTVVLDGYASQEWVSDGYLALNGSNAMSGDLDMGTGNIVNVLLVDGYNLPYEFQNIANDDAYQDAELVSINTKIRNHEDDTANPHATDIGNLGSGTLAELNSKVTDATLFDISQLDGYLALDGSDSMTGDLDVGGNNVTNVNLVDGYDLPDTFQGIANDDAYQDTELIAINAKIRSHEDDTANPHETDIGNLGSGTLSELNSKVTDATLFDRSELDGYQPVGPYITFTDIDGYAEKYLLDAYQVTGPYLTFSDIDGYAKKELLDGYLSSVVLDGYASQEWVSDGYLALNGSNAMSGDLDVGENNIISVGTVDGYDLPDTFQGIANDDAYQDGELTAINSALRSHEDDTANPHATDVGNLGSGTLAELNAAITDATLFDRSELDGYLALDGSNAMTGDLDVGGNNVTNVGTVDGYDLPDTFQSIANDDAYQDGELTAINTKIRNHEDDTANPHATDIGNLGSGTLAELNSIVTDATLFDRSELDGYQPVGPYLTFTDIDGYAEKTLLDGYQPVGPYLTFTDIDGYAEKTLLDSYATTSHASTHITGQSDEIDGDKLDIDWDPSNYVPSTDPDEVDSVDNLTAHLAGIDGYLLDLGNEIANLDLGGGGLTWDDIDGYATKDLLDSYATTSHASTHITSGSDEIDGDKVDIDWTPGNKQYVPTTSPSEVDSVDNLTAHLAGIGNAIQQGNATLRWNTARNITLTAASTWYDVTGSGFATNSDNVSINTTTSQFTFNIAGDYLVHYQFGSVTSPSAGHRFLVNFRRNGTTTYFPSSPRLFDTMHPMLVSSVCYVNSVSASDTGYLVVQGSNAGDVINVGYLGVVIIRIGDG